MEAAKALGLERAPSNRNINRAIARALSNQQKKISGLRGKLVETLIDVAFGDPREIMQWEDGGIDIKKSRELTPSQAAMVSSVTYDTKGNVQVKFDNKWRAMELLAKYASLANDNKEMLKIEGPTGWVEMVRAAAMANQGPGKMNAIAQKKVEEHVDSIVGYEEAAVDPPALPGEWEDADAE
jgi:hypothetical protein